MALVRVGLVVFVLAWIVGPYELRSAVPVWIPFVIALGLELHFFLSALRGGSSPATSRGPQDVDRERFGYPDEVDELLLVREGGRRPLDSVLGRDAGRGRRARCRGAGNGPNPAAAPARRAARAAPPAVARLLTGLAVIGALALVVWFVDSRSGWNGLSDETRREAAARFSAEASRIAGHPVTIRCDEGGDYVGAVAARHGVAAVGGELAYLTPDDLQRPLPPRLQGRGLLQPDGARDRSARARVVAPARRPRRGTDGVLRTPVGRRARAAARPLREHRAADDAAAAGAERASRRRDCRVPRAGPVPRRRRARPEPRHRPLSCNLRRMEFHQAGCSTTSTCASATWRRRSASTGPCWRRSDSG